jgi:tetratricopeptide (TPR) repeat protein
MIASEKIEYYSRCKTLDQSDNDKEGRQFGSGLLFALGLLDLERYDEAFIEAGRATAVNPQRWEPYYIAALALAANGQPEDATRFLDEAVSRAPEDVVQLIRQEMAASSPSSEGINTAVSEDGASGRDRAQYGALVEQGTASYNRGNYADATYYLNQAWAMDSSDERVGLMTATAALMAHDYAIARAVLDALGNSPNRATRKEVTSLRKQLGKAEAGEKQ